jgi:glycosyltransferase involved in cell wall biosynthesis
MSRLRMMSDRYPHELGELAAHIEFIKWVPNKEVEFVQSLDVGIMPLDDNLWSKGKCAYKMLLYSSCGIPVLVSPVGVNKIILGEADIGFGPRLLGEWYESLRYLFNDRKIGNQFGENGVKLVNDRYSVKICAPKIEKIIRQCI